jgi:glycerol-3-phosphate dehydrogenase
LRRSHPSQLENGILTRMVNQSRAEQWKSIAEKQFDVVIIGGGINGVGILKEATRAGLTTLLVEAKDFAWGTSSRSSKMVHGGLRYLAQGQFNVMLESVRERERLLKDASGLVDPLVFLMPVYKSHVKEFVAEFGLSVYDMFAGRNTHRHRSVDHFKKALPGLRTDNLLGGFSYEDAQTDDARLVLRVLGDAIKHGAIAMNYVAAKKIIQNDSKVEGVEIEDVLTRNRLEVRARTIINATGAGTDILRQAFGSSPVVRPTRGSHLVFPQTKFPIRCVVAFPHPIDKRNVFAYPWQNHVLIGATESEHDLPLESEPRISIDEVKYLMAAVDFYFPGLKLTLADATASWAGVRPAIKDGNPDSSKESRESLIMDERGMISVAGGKLTTFRHTAHEVLTKIAKYVEFKQETKQEPIFETLDPIELPSDIPLPVRRRLAGYYGHEALKIISYAKPGELEVIPDTPLLWAELRYSAKNEYIVHLQDLLLRRARIGFTLSNGGSSLLDRVRKIVQPELGWDNDRWEREVKEYLALVEEAYSVPAVMALK